MKEYDNSILIYCALQTNRLHYIFNVIFKQALGLNFEITNDKDAFEQAECSKFSYTHENIFPGIDYISPNQLLFDADTQSIEIETFIENGEIAFFKSAKDSFFPFDIFAASFYLISRYEEYLTFKPDKYGRFYAEESFAFKNGFLEKPLVNIWILMFCEKLCEKFPSLNPKPPKYQFISTIDIDNAWAHLNKGTVRKVLSFAKYAFKGDFKGFLEKFRIIFHKKQDPYDNYQFINQVHSKFNVSPSYFILFSKYARYDKSPSPKNYNFRKLIRNISQNCKIGIHPSFRSNRSFKILEKEKKDIEKLIETSIEISRQHFICLDMPGTYENLIKLGIKQDYSMGYSSHIGFRASFCLPFRFFNLKTNRETQLEIIPFVLMDVCFKNYLKIEPEIALIKIKNIISSVKKVNGLFISIWHNENLAGTKAQTNWRSVFEQMLKAASDGNKAY